MYLESITIKNYRKFRCSDNVICFVEPQRIVSEEETSPKSVIAPSTTLIIGKNNAGKTTVINALKMLCQNKQPAASDFNISYLNELFEQYKKSYDAGPKATFEEQPAPQLEFTLKIKVDFSEEDLMTHLSSFISISEKSGGKPIAVQIRIIVSLKEESVFKEQVRNIFTSKESNEAGSPESLKFQKFYDLLNCDTDSVDKESSLFKTQFIDLLGDPSDTFSLKKLINIKEIKANRHLKEGVLSSVFNKIVAFQFTNDAAARGNLESSIQTINTQIKDSVGGKSEDISGVLEKIESSDRVNLNLSGNVTYDTVIKGLIKYNFIDGNDHIPEDQFGLGYINLLNIIGEIIHFVDSYEDQSHLSRINLLCIEEPEAFMHPQMQEFFIKRIDDAVKKALQIANKSFKDNKKTLQCQIAITTHSSHIVNSKIHSSNTFNNLNYLTAINKCTKAINLTDEAVVNNDDDEAAQKLNFIKKHIKYKVSELFFSDAIIFVEGITEETLLNYYLEEDTQLSKYYISVFNINGAHGKLYMPLAKKLGIPSLIVTDIDIKRAKCEKNEKLKSNETCSRCGKTAKDDKRPCHPDEVIDYVQITDLNGRITTNTTLQEFNRTLENKSKAEAEAEKLDDIDFFREDNLFVVFQKDSIQGQHATSLEEALILTNYDNQMLNDVLEECKPKIYEEILKQGNEPSRKNLIHNSYKLQKKLSDSKSAFSNKLLYRLLSPKEGDIPPALPNYLEDGLAWLVKELQTNSNAASKMIDNPDTDINVTSSYEKEVSSNDTK